MSHKEKADDVSIDNNALYNKSSKSFEKSAPLVGV